MFLWTDELGGGMDRQGLYSFFIEVCNRLDPTEDRSKNSIIARILAENAEVHTYKAKEMVALQGAPQKYIYFLISGIIRSYVIRPDGRELTNSFRLIHGEPFVVALLLEENDKTVEWIQVLEDAAVATVPISVFKRLKDESSCFSQMTVKALTESFEQHYELSKIRSLSVSERYQWLHKKYPELEKRVQKQYLASFLDMDKAVYSRCVKQARGYNNG